MKLFVPALPKKWSEFSEYVIFKYWNILWYYNNLWVGFQTHGDLWTMESRPFSLSLRNVESTTSQFRKTYLTLAHLQGSLITTWEWSNFHVKKYNSPSSIPGWCWGSIDSISKDVWGSFCKKKTFGSVDSLIFILTKNS